MTSSNTTASALPQGSLILVTGGSGFIGSHIANTLLEKGYRVRCATRDTEKVRWLNELFESRYGKDRFETIQVADMAAPSAYDEAVKGVSAIVHTATVLTFFSADPHEIVNGTVAGTVNLLNSAAKEQSVKRFVYTSSITAATLPKVNLEHTVDENTWNDEAIELAWAPPPYDLSRTYAVYSASKTQAEREAWQFVEKNKPGFVLNTILPGTVFGEIIDPVNQTASTAGYLVATFHGERFAMDNLPPQHFVSIVDVTLLHLAALIDPEIRNERILACAAPYTWNGVLSIMRRVRPDQSTIPEDIPNEGKDLSKMVNTRGAEILRTFGLPGWTELEPAILDNIKHA